MTTVKQRLERSLTGTALALERVLRGQARAGSAPSPRHVLVLHFPQALGVSVLETPVFEALRAVRPALEVTVAGNALAGTLLRHSPFVDRLIVMPDPRDGVLRAVRVLRRELGSTACDAVLVGSFDRQRALLRLAALASAGWRGGFTEEDRLCHRPLAYEPQRSVLDNNLRLAHLVGWSGVAPEPRVFFSERDLQCARRIVAPAAADGRPVLTVFSQGSEPEKSWHEDRMAQLLRFAAESGFHIVLSGAAGDQPALTSLQQRTGAALGGQTSILEATALCALSDLVLTVHSGPMHLARAVQVPTLVLAARMVRASDWDPPASPQIRMLYTGVLGPTPPEYRIDELDVDTVRSALLEHGARYPPSAAAREARVARALGHGDLLQADAAVSTS